MIKPSELRLGNIIDYFSESADRWLRKHIVTALTIECLSLGIDQADGIPLTEEWLKKFGFDSKDPVLFSNSDYDYFYLSDTKIKYVHQLQNLYFALTGKELEMK